MGRGWGEASNFPSERSCLRSSSYIFHWIHLKFCRLFSYNMKMCICFWNVDWTIFDGVIAYADLNFPSERSCLCNSSYIFHLIHLKICRLSTYIMKMCMCFWNFDLTITDGVIAHADLNFANHNLVSATPSTSFIGSI